MAKVFVTKEGQASFRDPDTGEFWWIPKANIGKALAQGFEPLDSAAYREHQLNQAADKPALAALVRTVGDVTLGGSDYLLNKLAPGSVKRLEEVNPKATFAGGIASFLVPGSPIAKVGSIAARAVGSKIASKALQVAARGATEAAYVGVSQGVRDVVTADGHVDPKEAASHIAGRALESAAAGSVLSLVFMGLGKLAGKVVRSSQKEVMALREAKRSVEEEIILLSKSKKAAMQDVAEQEAAGLAVKGPQVVPDQMPSGLTGPHPLPGEPPIIPNRTAAPSGGPAMSDAAAMGGGAPPIEPIGTPPTMGGVRPPTSPGGISAIPTPPTMPEMAGMGTIPGMGPPGPPAGTLFRTLPGIGEVMSESELRAAAQKTVVDMEWAIQRTTPDLAVARTATDIGRLPTRGMTGPMPSVSTLVDPRKPITYIGPRQTQFLTNPALAGLEQTGTEILPSSLATMPTGVPFMGVPATEVLTNPALAISPTGTEVIPGLAKMASAHALPSGLTGPMPRPPAPGLTGPMPRPITEVLSNPALSSHPTGTEVLPSALSTMPGGPPLPSGLTGPMPRPGSTGPLPLSPTEVLPATEMMPAMPSGRTGPFMGPSGLTGPMPKPPIVGAVDPMRPLPTAAQASTAMRLQAAMRDAARAAKDQIGVQVAEANMARLKPLVEAAAAKEGVSVVGKSGIPAWELEQGLKYLDQALIQAQKHALSGRSGWSFAGGIVGKAIGGFVGHGVGGWGGAWMGGGIGHVIGAKALPWTTYQLGKLMSDPKAWSKVSAGLGIMSKTIRLPAVRMYTDKEVKAIRETTDVMDPASLHQAALEAYLGDGHPPDQAQALAAFQAARLAAVKELSTKPAAVLSRGMEVVRDPRVILRRIADDSLRPIDIHVAEQVAPALVKRLRDAAVAALSADYADGIPAKKRATLKMLAGDPSEARLTGKIQGIYAQKKDKKKDQNAAIRGRAFKAPRTKMDEVREGQV